MEQQGLLIARSVCSMEQGGSVIQVLNPSPAPVMVYSNQKVGILQPLCKVEGVCAVEESDSSNGEYRNDQSTLEEAVKLMTARAKDLSSTERENLQSLLFEFGAVISLGDGDLVCTDVVKHQIDTGNAVQSDNEPGNFHSTREAKCNTLWIRCCPEMLLNQLKVLGHHQSY